MFGTFGRMVSAAAVLALFCVWQAPAQVILGTSGVSQNFDSSLGTTGTTPPSGWQVWNINPTGASNTTWDNTTGVGGGGVPVSGVTASPGLTAMDAPTGNNNNGYNSIGASGGTADRAIATAPTGGAGNAIEVTLTNGLGAPVSTMRVAYDIVRYSAVGTDNQLPGYWLFYSLDGGTTYNNVTSLNPTLAGPGGIIVPNSVGVTNVPSTDFTLATPWLPGQSLLLRWVDDNAVETSPDQIIGLDNVLIRAVPEPSSLICLSAAAVLAGVRGIRRRFIPAAA
jgi:hypothetical protein